MVRKCRGVAEVAVMEVDVRTRAKPELNDVQDSSSRKRRINGGEFEFSTTSYVRLRSRSRQVGLPESNSVPTEPVELTRTVTETETEGEDDRRSCSPSSDDASAFCCSSNGCSEVVEESIVKSVDLEEEKDEAGVAYNCSRERRETTPSNQFRSEQSDDMESPAGKSEATSGDRSSLLAKMPTDSELQEFFIVAEKGIQKRFAEKYNYDIVEDVPLEGRYEWVRLKP